MFKKYLLIIICLNSLIVKSIDTINPIGRVDWIVFTGFPKLASPTFVKYELYIQDPKNMRSVDKLRKAGLIREIFGYRTDQLGRKQYCLFIHLLD